MMITFDPYSEVPYGPDKLSQQIATTLDESNAVADAEIEKIRTSTKPLEEPIKFGYTPTQDSTKSTPVREMSIQSAVCEALALALDDVDEVVTASRAKVGDSFGLTTHPAVLKKSTRLLTPGALVKAYQYGYWPSGFGIVQGGSYHTTYDIDANSPFEFRNIDLAQGNESTPTEVEDDAVDDTKAVAEFSQTVTTDSVNWEAYLPLYKSLIVPAYRKKTLSESLDRTQFPDAPANRPAIKDRFESTSKPRVGDFIRMAILRRLEQKIPSIVNISTGPDPWDTSQISMVVRPTAVGEPGITGGQICPHETLAKLCEYGYRPTDAWYDSPVVGHQGDDPTVPRRIRFKRGEALKRWSERTLAGTSLFDELEQIKDHFPFVEFDMETLLPCLRSHILTYEKLLYDGLPNEL